MLALAGLISSFAMANPLCTGLGATPTQNLTFWIANYNSQSNACQIGDKIFWNFAITTAGGGFGPDSDHVTVQPIPFDLTTNIGISFNSAQWVADIGFPIDSVLSYDVATISGFPAIKDATLNITGTLTGSGATADTTETLTPSVPGNPLHAILNSPAVVTINFLANAQNHFHVVDEVKANCGTCTGGTAAHISIVENDFSQIIPEPEVTVLIGSGLLLFGLVRRRQARK
jgi:hypothetical protein